MKKNLTNEGLRPLDNEAQMSTKPSVEALAGVSACSVGCGCGSGTGAGTGPDDCMSEEFYETLCRNGALKSRVYVCGLGWRDPQPIGSGCACGSGCDWGTGCDWGSGSYSGSNGNTDFGSGCVSGSSGSGSSSVSGCAAPGLTGEKILQNALKYKDVPYVPGGQSEKGMDCSGLITVACELSPDRFTTREPDMLTNHGFKEMKDLKAVPGGSPLSLMGNLHVGDILLWEGHHVAIYAGNFKLFHAHGKIVGYTSDFATYWYGAYNHSLRVFRINN